MEARILKWKAKTEFEKATIEEIEALRIESIRREAKERNATNINGSLDKVPYRFRGKCFADYEIECEEQHRAKLICERFVNTFKERLEQSASLMFLGSTGTGKTLLSLIIYQSLVKLGFKPHYESSLSFLKLMLDKRFESSSSYKCILDSYIRPDLLIIDEISESVTKDGIPSEIERKLLFEVINSRYELGNRCTLIISNRSKSELTNRLSQPVIDRLSENGITLIFNWNSFRQK